MSATDPGRRGASGRSGLDPTRMVNQPALRTSSGRVWLVMGGLFAAVSLLPLGLLIFAGDGRSRGVAIPVAVAVVLLFAAIVVARLVLPGGPVRLRTMAACMITMAAVALLGVWVCGLIETAG